MFNFNKNNNNKLINNFYYLCEVFTLLMSFYSVI